MATLLYNRTAYTFNSSTLTARQLVAFCVANGYKSVAVTDRNVLFAIPEFCNECRKQGIKPIIGMETETYIEDLKYTFILYARNNAGYQQLISLSSQINDAKEKVELKEILSEDLITVELEDNGFIGYLFSNNLFARYEDLIRELASDRNFYIGIDNRFTSSNSLQLNYYENVNNLIINCCRQHGLKTVAMPKGLYLNEADREAYKVLLASGSNSRIDDSHIRYENYCHLKTQSELFDLFDNELIGNTDRIATDCNTDLAAIPVSEIPKFPTPENVDSFLYLQNLAQAGLRKRLNGKIPEKYQERLNYELSVIRKMRFSDYFLIVWDIVLYASRNNIYYGMGRGSSAGCLVAYCLGITHVDPIKYNLLFERFLNPERVSMPDIDVDFPDEKRDEILQYITEKYGKDHTSRIIAFGTYGPKLAATTAIKALGYENLNDSDKLIRLIRNDSDNSRSLRYLYQNDKVFKQTVDSSKSNSQVYDIASRIEGLPKYYTLHGAGIVISDRPLNVNMPVIRNDFVYLTQYSKDYLETFGLIKMDILSLKYLTVISNIVSMIKEKDSTFSLMNIPLDDRKSFDILNSRETTGIFQLEQSSGRNILKRFKVNSFDDIAILEALIRPGASGSIDDILKAYSSGEISYPCDELAGILKDTYGQMIYQEQAMLTTQIIAGFTLGKADILRKAMAHKQQDEVNSFQQEFVSGALAKGYSQEKAEEIFSLIRKFGEYGFNKSHSVAYGMLTYQTAYLKANYPYEFYTVSLNSNLGNREKANQFYFECNRRGIKVLPPDINDSTDRYIVTEKGIQTPLNIISDVDSALARNITVEKQDKPFMDFFDFISRCRNMFSRNNDKALTALIQSGALDCFKLSRNTLLKNLESIHTYCSLADMFDDASRPVLTSCPDNARENSSWQFARLGFYFNGHPVSRYRKIYKDSIFASSAMANQGLVRVILMIKNVRNQRTKAGDSMAFVTGEDESGEISLAIMPDILRQYGEILKRDSIIYVEGIAEKKFNSIKANKIVLMER